jgi:hypothetical protein
MSDFVSKLSKGEHLLEVSLRPARTVDAFKQAIDRGFVHIKFTNTRGGTELGVRVDRELSDFRAVDFVGETGRAKIVGGLVLDYIKVRCIADIELPSLDGKGRLEIDGE